MEARRALIRDRSRFHALVAGAAIVLASLSGAAVAGDDPSRCEDRCEEKLAACESDAEARHDDCARDAKKEWADCACGADVVPEDVPPRCVKVCKASQAALAACDARREKRRDKCEEKRDRCAGNCD